MKSKPGRNRRKVIAPVESKRLSKEMEARKAGFDIERILVPVDFSKSSERALRHAASLAQQFQASISCLHVIDASYGAGEFGVIAEINAFRKTLDEQSKQQMDALRLKEIPDTVASDSAIRLGVPYHEIVQHADHRRIDLIVMGTRGYAGLSRVILGSTAERVVRHAHCPVLVMPEGERKSKSGESAKRAGKRSHGVVAPKRILVTTDFSDESRKAFRYAVAFAEQFGGSLDVVTSVNLVSFMSGIEMVPMAMDKSAILAAVEQKLFEWIASEVPSTVQATPWVREGTPFLAIVAIAQERGSDVIVISTHGYSGLKHIFLGSTAERVVRHAPCPVMVVRQHERDFLPRSKRKTATKKTRPMRKASWHLN